MRPPECFFAYAPRGVGLLAAVAYLDADRDVYGWFAGPRADGRVLGCYFLLEGYHSSGPVVYEAVEAQDLYGGWSLEESRRHELSRLEEAVAREWLFARDDPQAEAERRSYAEAELALGALGVRFERLRRFSTDQPVWTYFSPGFQRSVLRQLARRWPLDFRPQLEESA
ncbi:MAG: hypothetical protein RML56_05760 [Burkholderiales bacterium]|nr:hypothetical protein [Burkholderiales bacterium]